MRQSGRLYNSPPGRWQGAGKWPGLGCTSLVTLLLALLLPGDAQAQPCPRLKQAPKVTVKAAPGELQLDRTLDDQGLKSLVQKLEHNMHLTRGQPLGLTIGPLGARYRTGIRTAKRQHGGYCVWLTRAEVTVGYETLQVFVDQKYEKGSCEYDAIMEHEMQHVAINRETLKAYMPRFRDTVVKAARYKPSMHILGVPRQAKDAYLLYLKRRLDPILRALEAERRRKNANIDTPESYQDIQSRCENW